MKPSAEELGPPAERSIRRRGIAGSLLLHLALIAALLGWWRPSAPPEPTPHLIKLVLGEPGAAGAAGGSGGTAAAEGDAAQSASAAAATAEAAATPAQAAATQQPESAPESNASEPTLPETTESRAPEPVPTPAPVPSTHPEPKTAAVSVPPPPRPQRKPPPHPARVAAAPPPAPQPPAAPITPPTPAPEAPTASAAAAPGSGNGAGTQVGQGQGTEGAGRGVFGNGALEGPGDEYLEKLRRWLAKYKQYPQAAIDKKEEGKVVVGFTLRRDGTVLTAWIERSSGIALLDQAALAMMQRASPVPPVPDRYQGNELKLAMPVDYSIGFFERLFR